jgi:hypothetical protein
MGVEFTSNLNNPDLYGNALVFDYAALSKSLNDDLAKMV